MFTSFLRFGKNSIKMARKYPKLSFLGGAVAITSSSFFFRNENNKVLPHFFSPQVGVPGIRMHKTPKKPMVNLEDLNRSIQKLPIKNFKTSSPLYRNARNYEGYDLLDILASMKINPAENDLIIFEAKDGFKSHIPLKLIIKYRPLLAVRQESTPESQDWEIVEHSLNGKTDGGPFYLMWPGRTSKEVADNHWPFGVVNITFGSFQKIFGEIAPKRTNDPVITNGFKLFAENCSCCHTLFKRGTANVGTPVEEIPKKYPSTGLIADYAENPPPLSLMPKQDLSREELDAIEKYIRFKTEEGILEDELTINLRH